MKMHHFRSSDFGLERMSVGNFPTESFQGIVERKDVGVSRHLSASGVRWSSYHPPPVS